MSSDTCPSPGPSGPQPPATLPHPGQILWSGTPVTPAIVTTSPSKYPWLVPPVLTVASRAEWVWVDTSISLACIGVPLFRLFARLCLYHVRARQMYLLKQGCKRQRNATDRDKFRLHFAFFAFSRGNNHPMNQRINHSTARRYALPCRRKFAQAADNLGVVQRGLARSLSKKLAGEMSRLGTTS